MGMQLVDMSFQQQHFILTFFYEKLAFVVGYVMTSKKRTPFGVYVLWFATIVVSYNHLEFRRAIVFDFYKLIIDIFCKMYSQVRANPSGALSSLVFMCNAIASWNVRMLHCVFSRS